MSSLKDIMDVDVEPLQSQAYRRAKEAAEQQASRPSIDRSSATPSPQLDDKTGHAPIKRRRSNRVSKPSGQPSSSSRPSTSHRRSSAGAEAMDFTSGYQAGGSNQASMSGSPQQSSSRGSEPAADVPVKYTPVTGRISRAKKGVPVHTCDICRPVKTFTRAEHLRRHQLSHQKPAYPCSFRDCERAFHRPDLLARHLHRHETQGEKPYKSPSGRSRETSSPADNRTPPLKVETPSQGDPMATVPQSSPSDSITPRTTASIDGSMTVYSAMSGNFHAVNFSPRASPHKRSASEAQLPGADPYSAVSPGTSGPPSNFNHMSASFPTSSGPDLSNQGNYGRPIHEEFEGMYSETNNSNFTNYNTPHALPLLRIPEEPYIPGLSYTQDNSPWCSSASDSTYSTQSDGSRNGRHWGHRARSASVNTAPDWSAGIPQYSPHGIIGTPHDLRGPQFESMLDQYETPYTSPRMTPPASTRQLLDVPNSFGGYYMESVGTPALPTYNKPLAQLFSSASPSRVSVSDAGLVSIDKRQKMDSPQQLGGMSMLALKTSYPPQLSQLDTYISSYWEFFNQLFPIIHHGTFDPTTDMLLSSAMAAIGTQYHDTVEARQRGVELNKYCRESIDHLPNWNLQTMQAIFLTEVFTRFRGRKTAVKLSRQFEELYSRLLNSSGQEQPSFSSHLSGNVTSIEAHTLLDRFSSPHPPTPQSMHHPDLQGEWVQWIETEARQRLLNCCFMFDVHQSIYHEQSRSKAHIDESNSLLFLPCPENLWNASCASEWQAQDTEYTVQPLHIIEQELSPQYLASITPFSRSLLTISLARRLPGREDSNYPNDFLPNSMHHAVANLQNLFPNSTLAHTYLALHHTPLHDLLAIAGDTWVFARKVTPPSAFHSAQARLKIWSSSLAAAAATQHACRHLSLTLTQAYTEGEAGCRPICISDYWALYTSALICWAFGHKYQSAGSGSSTISRSSSSTAINSSSMDIDSPQTPTDEGRLKALTYVNGMLELSTEELLTGKASMRGDTSGVIDLVRARLERENTGHKCALLIDALLVLTRIKEGGRARFF